VATSATIPREMRALRATASGADLEDAVRRLAVERVPVPEPGPGQLLVRMHAAPCSQADLLYITARYGIDRPLPATPGFEGAGEVVASGGGILGRLLVGRRVAAGGHESSGTWAEYCVAGATQCLVLRDDLSFEQGATALANPITALALLALARNGGHRALVQTAAAGQLARALRRAAAAAGVGVIDVVRRAAQAEALRAEGADALASEAPDFLAALTARARALSATIAFDAVGGAMTGTLVEALPRGGEVVVYGALSGERCGGIPPMQLAFGAKRVRGFEIATHLKELGLLRGFMLANAAQRLAATGVTADISARVSLEEAPAALLRYVHAMSAGKVLLTPLPSPAPG
jgi:NADPH:quinone reductase-like Zn-dependent oxidoreductase